MYCSVVRIITSSLILQRDSGSKEAELTPADVANVGSLLTSPSSDSDLTLDSEQLGSVMHRLNKNICVNNSNACWSIEDQRTNTVVT